MEKKDYETSDNKNLKFTNKVSSYLLGKHFDMRMLMESYETEDKQYAKDVLKKLHKMFVDTYGTSCIDDIDDDYVYVPAVISSIDTGKICIGLVYLDRTSSGEHWDTVFITKNGIISHTSREVSKSVVEEMKTFLPYRYYYTAEYAGDIHVNKNKVPKDIKEMLDYAVAQEPTQKMSMDGM